MKKKKIGAEPEMGYCPFEHWLGAGTGVGARRQVRQQALGPWAARAQVHGALGRAGTGRRPGRGLGVLLGQQVVHSVHSACF